MEYIYDYYLNDAEPEYKNYLLNDNQSFTWNVRIVFVVYPESLMVDRFNNVNMHNHTEKWMKLTTVKSLS